MAQAKKCFVISPIGPDGSPIRERADDLFELVIVPALEPFNFEVIRADKIPRPTAITSDIVQLVQEATLCIVDLTGNNPNVFYECGRRHETGRPSIQLIQRDEPLPFDVAGIRTIIYDLSTPRAVRDAVTDIREFVGEFERVGYGSVSSGVSLASLATSLDRIERTIARAASTPTAVNDLASSSNIDFSTSPKERFYELLLEGRVDAAAMLVPQLRRILSTQKLLDAAQALISSWHPAGIDVALDILRDSSSPIETDELKTTIGMIVQFYSGTDREDEALRTLKPTIEMALTRQDLIDRDRAFLLNQLSKLHSGAGEHAEATKLVEQALQLNPQEPAYKYNLSQCYDELGMTDRAIALAEESIAMKPEASNYISNLVRLCINAGKHEKARDAFKRMSAQFPEEARTMLRIDAVREVVERESS